MICGGLLSTTTERAKLPVFTGTRPPFGIVVDASRASAWTLLRRSAVRPAVETPAHFDGSTPSQPAILGRHELALGFDSGNDLGIGRAFRHLHALVGRNLHQFCL